MEKLLLKVRCEGIDEADVITTEAGIATAKWKPTALTLRNDELSVVEQDPEEDETYSHENDSPEDSDVTGAGLVGQGSFIKATHKKMADFLGGKVVGEGEDEMFLKSAKKHVFEKALRFRIKGGGFLIVPRAKGYVNFNMNLGATDGMLKLPFKFNALSQIGFDCDIILNKSKKVDAPKEEEGGEADPAKAQAPVNAPEGGEVPAAGEDPAGE